jgi:hypothetical protein
LFVVSLADGSVLIVPNSDVSTVPVVGRCKLTPPDP